MSFTLGEAFISLGFNVDDAQLKAFNDKIDDLEVALFKVSGTAAAALYGIDRFLDSATRNALGLRDLSIQTGLSTKALQEWATAAHLSDTAFSTEAAESQIKSLQGHIAEAKLYGTGSNAFWRLIGLNPKDITDGTQVLQRLHERLPSMLADPNYGGPQGIASLMQQIGIGDQWLNLLLQQESQYKKTHEAAREYLLTKDEIANNVAIDYAMEQLSMKFDILKQRFAAAFAPEIISIMQKIPALLTNFATGLKALEVPLGIVIGLTTLLISPWVPFLVVLYDVLGVITIIGAKLNAKGDNWVKDIAHDFDVLLNSVKAVLNLLPGVHLDTNRHVLTKEDLKNDVIKSDAEIAKINERDSKQIGSFVDRLMMAFQNYHLIQPLVNSPANSAIGSPISQSNTRTQHNTVSIHANDAAEGADAGAAYINEVSKAFDALGNF